MPRSTLPRGSTRLSAAALLFALGMLSASSLACSGQGLITLMPGVVNDPHNLTLRRELLHFGTRSVCSEMLKRSVPLKLRDDDPSIGRFYVHECTSRDLDNGDLFIQFGGVGYAWSNLTKRIGFDVSAGIDYENDLRVDGGALYVYFRPASTTAKKFQLTMAESTTPNPLGALIPVPSAQVFADQMGSSFLDRELARGFTVIRDDDGSVSFAMGQLPPGQRPAAPYSRENEKRLVLMNERVDVHQNQRDFAGPFEVTDSGMALYITANVEGTPAIDISVYQRSLADSWLSAYIHQPVVTSPTAAAVFDEPVRSGAIYRRVVRLPKGQYYVLLDNTPNAGQTTPAGINGDDRAASVSLGVELGSEP